MPKRSRTTHGIESKDLSEQESDALSIPQKKRRRTTQEVVDAVHTTEQAEALRPRQNKSAIVRDAILVSSESPEPVFPKRESSVTKNTIQIPPNAIANTSLLVSASDRPARAPANVPLEDCLTQAQLFETLIIECNLKGRAAAELSEVSATYTWGQRRQHLIRKGRARDWSIFCMDIKKAWERESAKFSEDGCEIKMMVHIDY